jgi:hypothetical protein
MCSCDLLLRISPNWGRLVVYVGGGVIRGVGGRLRRRRGVVGFEDVEAFELLVQNGEWLELLCLLHLRLEPVLDFILLLFDEVLVVVVEMSMNIRLEKAESECGSDLFSCSSVTCHISNMYIQGRHQPPTISSLHIGHTSLLDALAAAFSLGPSSTLLLMSSLISAVLAGLCDVCELRDTELGEGERKLALRRCCGCGWGDMAGDRFFPLPSTRPPPRDLREAMAKCRRGSGESVGWGMQPRRRVVAGAVYKALANVAAAQG